MIIGIIRGANKSNILQVVEAGFSGGLDQIEITLNSLGALEQIKIASKKFDIGAGTVLSLAEAKKALDAGAKFIVSPITDPATVKYCQEHNIPVYPSGITANEVYNAWNLGATMVKVFPVKCFGGPALIKELKGPFDEIKLMAVGGITPENVREYLAAGADAVAIGASVFKKEWMEEGDYKAIEKAVTKTVKAMNL